MAECKDISRALAELSRKIDKQNQCCEANKKEITALGKRVGDLERSMNGSQKLQKNLDLKDILRRLAKLEKDDTIISAVVADVINDVKDVIDTLNEHNQNAKENTNVFSKFISFLVDE